MTYGSLRLRLLIAWAVFIAVTLQVASVGLRVLFERAITRRTQSELEADLRQLRRGMTVSPSGEISIAREPTDPQFDIVFGGRYWQIDENGKTLSRSRSLSNSTLNFPALRPRGDEPKTIKFPGPEGQKLFAVVRKHSLEIPGSNEHRTLKIITAVDAAEIDEDANKFASELFSSLTGLALLLLLGAYAHVTIGLQPLEKLRAKVAGVRSGKATLVDGAYPDEVMPLVDETNALLAEQEKELQTARARAGDLAHGLNTPLAIMAANARTLRRSGQLDIAAEIDRQIESMRRHVDRELARARARGARRSRHTPIDIATLLSDLVTVMRSLSRDSELQWTIDAGPNLEISVDADDFNNMMGNLLENAQKWASNLVRVTARKTLEGIKIDVEDDGPGVPDDMIDRVLLRGERADTSVNGSGLGLAIVNDLVELYRGSLQLSRSPLGGLTASLILPN